MKIFKILLFSATMVATQANVFPVTDEEFYEDGAPRLISSTGQLTEEGFKEAGIMPLQRLGNEVPTEEDIAAEISLLKGAMITRPRDMEEQRLEAMAKLMIENVNNGALLRSSAEAQAELLGKIKEALRGKKVFVVEFSASSNKS